MRKIDSLVVHCADTPARMDIGADTIDVWHKQNGWQGIGYHFVIRRDGTQERGRDVAEVGAHVAGHNANSIGICLVGGKGGFNFTMRQMDSLKELLLRLVADYPDAEILGHTDLDSRKTCPNFDVKEWWQG